MNQVFPLENEKSWKSLYVTSDQLFLIDKSYDDAGSFLKGFQDDGLGRFLKQKKTIGVATINGLQHAEKKPTDLTLQYESAKVTLTFKNEADLQAVTNFLAAERKLSAETKQVSKFGAIQSPLIGLALSVGIGWVLYSEAQTIEAGGHIEVTGRRAGVKRLFAWVAETLGTTGVLVIAGVAVVACLYFIYRNLQTPPNKVVYTA